MHWKGPGPKIEEKVIVYIAKGKGYLASPLIFFFFLMSI